MRLISTKSCQPGMILAKTLYNDLGQVLLSEGIPLTQAIINKMQERGITLVYVHDERTKDIEVEELLSEKTRRLALHTIKDEFNSVVTNGQLVHTVHSAHLGKRLREVVKSLLSEIKEHQQVLSILTDVSVYDHYTFQHSLNVTIYTLAMALQKGYNETQLEEIGLGAILHDIGKLAVPLDILNKKGTLTNEEFALMQEHTTNGFELLRKIYDLPLSVAHCAYQHHERLDGTGYPRQLKGNEIHPYAKILAITDVFDALTSERSYHKAMLPDAAIEIIYSGAGEKFDFDLVQTFKNTIAMYPIGIMVKLSNGYSGVVIEQNRHLPSRPIVRLIKDPVGQDLDSFEEIDLAERLAVVIVECDLKF